MKEGKFRVQTPNGAFVATIDPEDGWTCPDSPDLVRKLGALYPLRGTEAGFAWIAAFHRAAKELHATVLGEPEADRWEGGRQA